MLIFTEFDPLKAKQAIENEAAINAVKRELRNILDSYFSWHDPFCELIQNSLDALEEKCAKSNDPEYKPYIWITIDLNSNSVCVTDNGIGLDKQKYEQFLAPSFSFKKGKTRGHKGVGATYLAYGFNYIQICTKASDFEAIGKMLNAREWLQDENPAGNPKVQPDSEGAVDEHFKSINTGVSICIKFDQNTHPGDLSWLKANSAEQWYAVLFTKTGLGAFFPNEKINVVIKVLDMNGTQTQKETSGIQYYWPHLVARKTVKYSQFIEQEATLYKKHGKNFKLPGLLKDLDAIYDYFTYDKFIHIIDLDENEKNLCERYNPCIYICYFYTSKWFSQFNTELGIRQNIQILSPGIQIAANNMPQGELYQIQLKRYIGRQNQIHCLIHFDNCKADLGRKGFQKEIVEFCLSMTKKLIDGPFQKVRYALRPTTGVIDDLGREERVDLWKDEMIKHEQENPLDLISDNFFLPINKLSITSIPTREQDVIALFNQLIAGGVIRGIRIMSTNERFTYDGMYRIIIEKPTENHIYDCNKNPLGILPEYTEDKQDFLSKPKILEYKYLLDGLIEDIETGDKNSNDIGLVVVWETGEDFKGNYHITSLLDENNLSYRQYHGISHIITNINTNQKEMDLIVLKELIEFLKNPTKTIDEQRLKYE